MSDYSLLFDRGSFQPATLREVSSALASCSEDVPIVFVTGQVAAHTWADDVLGRREAGQDPRPFGAAVVVAGLTTQDAMHLRAELGKPLIRLIRVGSADVPLDVARSWVSVSDVTVPNGRSTRGPAELLALGIDSGLDPLATALWPCTIGMAPWQAGICDRLERLLDLDGPVVLLNVPVARFHQLGQWADHHCVRRHLFVGGHQASEARELSWMWDSTTVTSAVPETH